MLLILLMKTLETKSDTFFILTSQDLVPAEVATLACLPLVDPTRFVRSIETTSLSANALLITCPMVTPSMAASPNASGQSNNINV